MKYKEGVNQLEESVYHTIFYAWVIFAEQLTVVKVRNVRWGIIEGKNVW